LVEIRDRAAERKGVMTGKSQLASTAVAVSLALALNAAGASAQQAGTTQVSPQATEPLPAQGAGQAAQGAAVTGSAPAPASASVSGAEQPTTLDDSQEQRGVLLKPGTGADDMDAASGATAPPSSEPAQ
jgi:hypothetical protein